MARAGFAGLLIALGLLRGLSAPLAQEVQVLPPLQAPLLPAPVEPAPKKVEMAPLPAQKSPPITEPSQPPLPKPPEFPPAVSEPAKVDRPRVAPKISTIPAFSEPVPLPLPQKSLPSDDPMPKSVGTPQVRELLPYPGLMKKDVTVQTLPPSSNPPPPLPKGKTTTLRTEAVQDFLPFASAPPPPLVKGAKTAQVTEKKNAPLPSASVPPPLTKDKAMPGLSEKVYDPLPATSAPPPLPPRQQVTTLPPPLPRVDPRPPTSGLNEFPAPRPLPNMDQVVDQRSDRLLSGQPVPSKTALENKGAGDLQADQAAFLAEPDLTRLWALAQTNHPDLEWAVADVEGARGVFDQAGKLHNPRLNYTQDSIGSGLAQQGNFYVAVKQDIITGGKRHLDKQIAALGIGAAEENLALRRHEVLAKVRRQFFEVQIALAMARLERDAAAILQQRQVQVKLQLAKTSHRTPSEIGNLENLLEEAKLRVLRADGNLQAAWHTLTTEVGLPPSRPPTKVKDPGWTVPAWSYAAVWEKVQSSHASLRRAYNEAEAARLGVRRARADALPDVMVGGGVNVLNTQGTQGALVTLEVPLPVFDRSHGKVRACDAQLARAQAGIRQTEIRLQRETIDAFGRFDLARQQLYKLTKEVLPGQQQRVDALHRAQQAHPEQVDFKDTVEADQRLNAICRAMLEARLDLGRAYIDLLSLMQMDGSEEVK